MMRDLRNDQRFPPAQEAAQAGEGGFAEGSAKALCVHAPAYDAGLCCGHPDDCTFVRPQAPEDEGEHEDLRRERDAYKAACKRIGVCMSCVVQAPETFGCIDCLNTGMEGGGVEPVLKLLNAARAAKKYLEPDLVEPGRTVFWGLVNAIKGMERANVL